MAGSKMEPKIYTHLKTNIEPGLCTIVIHLEASNVQLWYMYSIGSNFSAGFGLVANLTNLTVVVVILHLP